MMNKPSLWTLGDACCLFPQLLSQPSQTAWLLLGSPGPTLAVDAPAKARQAPTAVVQQSAGVKIKESGLESSV